MKLIINAYGLPEGETKLLQAIVRLSDQLGDAWRFGNGPACDVLLADGEKVDQALAGGMTAREIIRVVQRDMPCDDNALIRPIHAEQFIRQLVGVATRLRFGRNTVSASDGVLRRRLNRWPAARLLESDRSRIRLATLLLREALSIEELSERSGQSVRECADFLSVLEQHGMLTQENKLDMPDNAAKHSAKASQELQKQVPRGFLASIRRRLGLD